jgi:very-short-patch-repair endonuclease
LTQPLPEYDDGLDADGYSLPPDNRGRFIHGDESAAGGIEWLTLAEVTAKAIDRINLFLEVSPDCESPIENLLGAAVLEMFERAGVRLTLCNADRLEGAPDGLLLVPQFRWGYYRSDWAIVVARPLGALLIECDGRDFHSSPEQKAHDAKKDRAALDRGYLTMRFTGSEIFRNADACALKIYDAICGGEA